MSNLKSLIDMVVARAMDYEASHETGNIITAKKQLDESIDDLKFYLSNLSAPSMCSKCRYLKEYGDDANSFYCALAWKEIQSIIVSSGKRPDWCPLLVE